MLTSLSVRNYALITELTVQFDMGLSTITGETGAGKSILMGALSLILGNRAETGVLKDKEKKCVVEAVFRVQSGFLSGVLEQHNLDVEDQIILRREIVPSGKSRAFVNDTPVVLPVMKEIGQYLVNIHAQNENLMLNQENFPVLAIDSFLKLDPKRERFNEKFSDYSRLLSEYEKQKTEYEAQKRNQDFLEFQLNQLIEANLDEELFTELEQEKETLEHAEEIQSQLGHFLYLFEDDERSVLSEIKQGIQGLRNIEPFMNQLTSLLKRMDESYVELKDIVAELNDLKTMVESDPNRLQYLQDRLDLFYTLEQKHQVNGQPELIRLRDNLQEQLSGLELQSGHLDKMAEELQTGYKGLMKMGYEMSDDRKRGLSHFCDQVEELLNMLGMDNARFTIRHTVLAEPLVDGLDEMEFMFSANKNQEVQLVSKVASGGEVSRLMLSIKALISQSLAVPTLIFDEIDAGVSGEIADKMGQLIKRIAESHQVLNITHLPQVAGHGDNHYLVYKFDDELTTHTQIKRLDHEERVIQLAKMLSGETVTDEAVNNARQLLN